MTLKTILSQLSPQEGLKYAMFLLARSAANLIDVAGLSLLALTASALANPNGALLRIPFTAVTLDLDSNDNLIGLFVALLGLFIFKSLLGATIFRSSTLFLSEIDTRQSRTISNFLFLGPLARVSSLSNGEINWSVMRSTQTAFSVILFALSSLATELTLLLGIAAVLIVFDPLVSSLLLAYLIAVGAFYFWLVSNRAKRLGERLEQNTARGHEIVDAILNSRRETGVSGTTVDFIDWLFSYRAQQARDYSTQRFIMALPRYVVEVALLGGVLLLVVGQTATSGLTAISTLGVFLFGGLRLTAALLPIQNALTELRLSLPQARLAVEILSRAQEETGRNTSLAPDTDNTYSPGVSRFIANSLSQGRGLTVTVHNLSFDYGQTAKPALTNVSLSIESGEVHALVGPSGSGKSTLADCIIGAQNPTSGSITIEGHHCAAFVRDFPGLVSYVPQKINLVPGTLLQNISLRRENSISNEGFATAALEEVGLSAMVSSVPQGLHTPVGNQLNTLSGGQLQRLAIARALFTRPRLIVLDEPTSSLDAAAEAVVNETIFGLRGSTTVIVVAHRVNLIRGADQIHFLSAGHLLHSGSFAELRARVREFDDYVKLLSAKRRNGESSSAQ